MFGPVLLIMGSYAILYLTSRYLPVCGRQSQYLVTAMLYSPSFMNGYVSGRSCYNSLVSP